MPIDGRAEELLHALNDLFAVDWTVVADGLFYRYVLKLDVPDRLPFEYHRCIKPAHINSEPYRTALLFADEVCERYGRYALLKPDDAQDTIDATGKV